MVLRKILVVVMALAAGPASAVTTTFINEIHYDNNGSDIGEGVEIAGVAGVDLGGWRIVLYNGTTGGAYADTTLEGLLPDLGGGFGAVFVPMSGMQNGGPDGIALVDAGGSVMQFLSYEGSLTATSGIAAGMTSTDIGVFEDVDSPVGQSLQLVGSGIAYEDFAWVAAMPATYGAFNTGQSFAPVPLPGALTLFSMAIATLAARRSRRNRSLQASRSFA